MCIFFLITFAAVVVGVPQDCTEYCKSVSPKGIWFPWCDCSAKPPESVMSATPDAPSFSDKSKYEGTDIYYEPDETEFKFQTNLHFEQPFYITNPTPKLKLKTPKRELKNTQLIDTSIFHETPFIYYLDIIVEDHIESRDSKESEDLELTEKSLMECLDLHVVAFSRRGVNITIGSELVQRQTLKKYEAISNADVITAIKSKCSQSLEMVNCSLQRIQKAQPKKKGSASSNSEHLDNSHSTSLLDINMDSLLSSDENKSFDDLSTVSREPKLDLLETNLHIHNAKADNETVTRGSILDLAATTSNESNSDNSTSQSKLVSTRSTLSSSNIGVFDYVSVPKMKDTAQDHSHNSGKKETTTDDITIPFTYSEPTEPQFLTEFPNVLIDGSENTSFLSPEVSIIDETYRNNDYNQSQISHSDSEDTTTQINIETYSIEDEKRELVSASTITHGTHTPKFERDSEEGYTTLTDYPTTSSINQEGSSASQSFYTRDENISKDNNYEQRSDDVTEKLIERRIYNESEILIPKILTKELANGTVVTTIQGYESLPNMDDTKYEDSITAENAQLSSRRTFDSSKNQMPHYQTGISGKLYFIFDKALIPARFLQNSDGLLSLGLDGNSMCQNLLKNHESRSHFLSKLCKSINTHEYDEIPSAAIHDVEDISI